MTGRAVTCAIRCGVPYKYQIGVEHSFLLSFFQRSSGEGNGPPSRPFNSRGSLIPPLSQAVPAWEGDSLRPSSLVNHYTFFFFARATGDEAVGRVGYKLLLEETEDRMADRTVGVVNCYKFSNISSGMA